MKFQFRFTIARKLALVFSILLVAVLSTSVLTYKILRDNMEINTNITKVYTPSASRLNDLTSMIINSKLLIKNWIYVDKKNTKDKDRLREIHSKTFPDVQKSLAPLVNKWNETDQQLYEEIVKSIDTLFQFHQEIMSQLNSFDSYENIMVLFVIYPRVEEGGEVTVLTDRILDKLGALTKKQVELVDFANANMESSFSSFQDQVIIIGIILVFIVLVLAAITTRALVIPINYIKEIIHGMGKGLLPKDKIKTSSDEIGEMAEAINILVESLKKTSEFSLRIGEGDFTSEFKPLSDQDILGNSLVIMRQNLQNAQEEEEQRKLENTQRNWTAQGIAKFSEILRQHNDNIEELSFEVISNLVKYLEANMGGFFIINDNEKTDIFIELTASYAYTRKKFLKKRIEIGVTLIGQCVQEGETIYLTEIPSDFIKITSGLGEDNPTSLLIVPLKLNNQVYGVVEIASFKAFEKFQIEFVERIGETVASTIATVKINMNTSRLLRESQEKSERLAQQEEEMRQNIEEMQATQEELVQRSRVEKSKIQNVLTSISSAIGLVELGMNGEILTANERFLRIVAMKSEEIVGKHHNEFVARERVNSLEYQNFWTDLNNGIVHSGMQRYLFKGEEKWFYEVYTPVRDENAYLYKVISLIYDVSKNREAEDKLRRQLDKSNAEIERLKNRNQELERLKS